MNREIKFRGKRVDNGKWVYGYLVVRAGMPFIFSFGVIEPILVIPETVGQFTGLYDKNGKEIYEGDLGYWCFDGINKFLVKIFWAEQVAKFMGVIDDNNCYDFKDIQTNKFIEIIGNIRDNPELLEVKE